MKKIFLLAITLCLFALGYSQTITPQLISPCVNFISGGGYSLDYSLGEIATTSISGASNKLTQGFLQPYYTVAVTINTTNINCNSTNNGIATASVSVGVAPYNYIWNSGGKTSQTITGLTAGSYTVIVTDSNGFTGITSTIINAVPGATITGTTKYNNGSQNIMSGFVKLFEYANGAKMQMRDSVGIVAGNYTFGNVPSGNYVVYARPAATYSLVMASYYGDTVSWQGASTFTVDCNTAYTANIKLKDLPAHTGKGKITGNIIEGVGYHKQGDPVSGIDVSVGKKPSGATMAQTKTDVAGDYEFDNIDMGDYTIYTNIAGLPMASTYTISITATDTLFTAKDFTADSTHIFIDTASALAIKYSIFNTQNSTLKIFPNPYSGSTTLQYTLTEQNDVTIDIYSIVGEKVKSYQYNKQVQGVHTLKFSAVENGYPSGIYIIRLQIGNQTIIGRVCETIQ